MPDVSEIDDRRAGAASAARLQPLRVSNVSLSFGGIRALENVSFDTEPGIVKAIIGPNGAGKTTLLNCISGQYTPLGSIRLGELELTELPPHLRIHHGVARTFQNIAVFSEQSVLDNVMAGGHHRLRSGLFRRSIYWGRFGCREEEEELCGDALRLLKRLGLDHLAETPAGELSYGQQKRLEIGRALMAHPGLLLLDEPMAGMSGGEKEELCDFITGINRELGTTILMIEHDMSVVRSVSDDVVVLDFGRKIAEGPPDKVVEDERVRKAYLGEEGWSIS